MRDDGRSAGQAVRRDAGEGALLSANVRANNVATQAGVDVQRPGMTGRQVAQAIHRARAAQGSATEFCVVAFDVGGAFPHHHTGYGAFVVHPTGHGLGLQIREPRWITATWHTVVAPGMVFSIEPGV